MRFTTGQMWKVPAPSQGNPATPGISNFRHGDLGRDSRNHVPAISPRIIVPSVGMKLSVRYPPELYSNRFRAETSQEPLVEAIPKL